MAIAQALCSSFKQQILLGEHDLDTDIIKIALYTSLANLSAATTTYTATDEVVGTNYTAGGDILTGAQVSLTGTTAFATFSNISWPNSTITARGALIYNSSKSNKAVAVLDFGSDKSSSASTFTVQFPTNTAADAVIRIA